MAKGFDVNIDVGRVERLADKLGSLGGEDLAQISLQTVNEVASRAYDTSRARMNAGLSLTDAYLNDRLTLKPATSLTSIRATITADGRLTKLGHYDSKQEVQPVKNVARSKGDPGRGIAKGQKASGISVAVTRGNRKLVRQGQAFTIPKFKDSEGNPLIFKRLRGQRTKNGNDKLVPLLAPSVYQLFRLQSGLLIDDIADDLETTISKEAEALLTKALT